MDLITCKCAKCDAKLGTITNLWIQIGKNYIAPIAGSEYYEELHVSTSGPTRSGEADTVVGGCKLQDANCSSCDAGIGLKCLKSPLNHVLTVGQFILRTSSIIVKSAVDGRRKVEPRIKQSFKLRDDPSTTTREHPLLQGDPFETFASRKDSYHEASPIDSVDLIQIQADIVAQREEISRIDSAGFQVVSTFQSAITRVEQQVQKLNESIESVRKDGEGHGEDLRCLKSEVADVKLDCQNNSVISRLEQVLQTTNNVVTELRQAVDWNKTDVEVLRDELVATREELDDMKDRNRLLKAELKEAKQLARGSIDTSKEYASEVASLRREMMQLINELGREAAQATARSDPGFSAHELDILTSSISKIGNRASQIESLQMEFELFKTRVQRLEARPNHGPDKNDGQSSLSEGVLHQEQPQQKQSLQQRFGGRLRQKRTSTGKDASDPYADTPPKRMAMASDYSSAATGSYRSVGDWAGQSSPPTSVFAATDGSGPRLTNAGKVDRRITKHGSSNAKPRRSTGATSENRASY